MELSDLFVSHKLVEPVSFSPLKPEEPNRIYLNLNRALKAASGNTQDEDISDWNVEELSFYDWKVKPTVNHVENSNRLIDFLKKHESFRANVYRDPGGVLTIGYGFTDPEITKKGTITLEEALLLLLKDIDNRRSKLSLQITSWNKLNLNLLDALTSYAYNVGVENWAKNLPKLLKALNEERFADAAKYMDAVRDSKGKVLPGLLKRRLEEQEWFNS